MSVSNLPGPRLRRGALVLLWSGLPLVLGLALGATAADLLSPVELKPGLSVTRDIEPEETHFYRARLAAGDALHVRVDQGGDEKGLDIAVKLIDPTGESVTMDGLNGGRFPEELAWVARTSGEHRLTVRWGPGVGNRYRLNVIKLAPGSRDDSRREEALRLDQEAANLVAAQKDLPRQLTLRNQALGLWRRLGDRGREAQELYQLGAAHVALDEIGPGVERYRESAAIWHGLGIQIEQARLLNEIGKVLGQAGHAEEARRSLDASFRLAHELGDRPLQVYYLHNRGSMKFNQGEIDAAIPDLQKALALARGLGDPLEIARLLLELGTVHRTRGRFEEARRSFEEALSLGHTQKDLPIQAAAENGLGGLFQDLGDWDESIRHYQQAIELSEEAKQGAYATKSRINLALVHQRNQDFQHALGLFEKVLDTEGLESSDRATALNNMAFLQIERGYPGQALKLSDQALPLAASDPVTQAAILEAQGLARLELGDLNLSRQDLERARAISVRNDLRSRRAGLEVGLGRVAQADGDLPAALGHFREAVGLVESLRTGVQDDNLRALLMAARRNPYDLSVETLVELDRRQPGQGYGAESLRINEMGRARSLLDLLGAPGVSRSAPSRSLAEIQSEVLAPGVVLLEYALGENQSYLWAVTQDSLEIFNLKPRKDIEQVAREYSRELRFRIDRPKAEPAAREAADRRADHFGAQLSTLILAPAADRLRGARTVLVVNDGALQYIPLAALPAPSSSRRMIEEHAIVYLPSASVLASLRQEFAARQSAPHTLAVFYDPVFEPEDSRIERPLLARLFSSRQPSRQAAGQRYARLLSTQDEAAAILVPGETFAAKGFDASVEQVRRAPLDQYRFLHFATHGVIDSAHPERSSLIFSQYDAQGQPVEGALRLPDIYNLRLNADCVVLSACDTALGREIRGEGLIGFTRAFLDAGSRRVLASLWSIDDTATAKLMGSFYRSMLGGNSPAVALQKAQIEMLKTERSSAPYYWAGFSLQGEWR